VNVYRIRGDGSERLWLAETLNAATSLAFVQWCEERGEDKADKGAVAEFQQNFLQGADFIGELENG